MHTVIIIDEESGNVSEYNHVPDLRVITMVESVKDEFNKKYLRSMCANFQILFTLENPDDVLAYNLTSKKKGLYGDIL